jgi:hypothetical protein
MIPCQELSVCKAAQQAVVSTSTIRNWIRCYGIGRRRVGHYHVDPMAFARLLKGGDEHA